MINNKILKKGETKNNNKRRQNRMVRIAER